MSKITATFKRIFLIYPFVYVSKFLMRLNMFTCRVDIQGLDHFKEIAAQQKCILMLWHNRLALLPNILYCFARNLVYRAVISNSRDGELLAILAHSYSQGRVLRVPHNKRQKALLQMIQYLNTEKDVLIITPDGPRGPVYTIKPGIVMAAKQTNACIIPITWSANRFWELKTWDKLMLPKPFSKISIVFGDPITISKDSEQSLSDETQHLQDALQALDKSMR